MNVNENDQEDEEAGDEGHSDGLSPETAVPIQLTNSTQRETPPVTTGTEGDLGEGKDECESENDGKERPLTDKESTTGLPPASEADKMEETSPPEPASKQTPLATKPLTPKHRWTVDQINNDLFS